MAVWETVIGLEIHAQLATSSKIFSGASTSLLLTRRSWPGAVRVWFRFAHSTADPSALVVPAPSTRRSGLHFSRPLPDEAPRSSA